MSSVTHPKKANTKMNYVGVEFIDKTSSSCIWPKPQAQRVQSTCMVPSKVSVVGTSRTVWVSSPNTGNQSPFGNAVNPFRTPVWASWLNKLTSRTQGNFLVLHGDEGAAVCALIKPRTPQGAPSIFVNLRKYTGRQYPSFFHHGILSCLSPIRSINARNRALRFFEPCKLQNG